MMARTDDPRTRFLNAESLRDHLRSLATGDGIDKMFTNPKSLASIMAVTDTITVGRANRMVDNPYSAPQCVAAVAWNDPRQKIIDVPFVCEIAVDQCVVEVE